MKKVLFITVIVLLGNLMLLAQPYDFEYVVDKRKVEFSNLQAKSIDVGIQFIENKHCSVKLIEIDNNGNHKSTNIVADTLINIDLSKTQSFILIHRKKFLVRIPQKIALDESATIPPSSKKRLFKLIFPLQGRVRLSSQTVGGTTTTTTITST